MNPGQIDLILGQVEYKPGWKLRYHLDRFGDGAAILHLNWAFLTVDAYDPTREVVLDSTAAFLAEPLTEERLVREAFLLARRAEEHEAMEWFTYKGDRTFDPHKSLIGGPPV